MEIMEIMEINEYSDQTLQALNKLLPQLSPSIKKIKEKHLTAIIDSKNSHLLMIKKNGEFIATLTLTIAEIPTGTRACIEDVVVDSNNREQGAGKILIEHSKKLAFSLGARTINLTSRPSRKSANSLYTKTGFQIRKTNSYFAELENNHLTS